MQPARKYAENAALKSTPREESISRSKMEQESAMLVLCEKLRDQRSRRPIGRAEADQSEYPCGLFLRAVIETVTFS
jgi:hypothetical protein